MLYVVVARDPQIDLYREDDLYGVEVVEAENADEAIAKSEFGRLSGLFIIVTECANDMPLGECNLSDIRD